MRRQRGFTYVGLLLFVALMGTVLSGAGTLWSIDAQREKEADLLFFGDQFTAAITSFRDRTPAGQQPRFPRQLQELLDDRRWPTPRRHLRQVYVDPMTNNREWGLVRTPGGEITGVYSQSARRPLKQGGFPERLAAFEGAEAYSGWRFMYTAPDTAAN
jgi:type II secretory pathway pseudopilin PulG